MFVWMIFFRHFTEYINKRQKINKISILIDRSLEQNIVSLFLFYSGYGIYESYKLKGNKYIKSLPLKSLILFIKSQIVLLLFLLNNNILGIKTSLKDILLSIIFKKGIGNSYWFNFTIILLYNYSFFSFIFVKKKFNFLSIIFINIICYFHIKFVFNYYHRNIIISINIFKKCRFHFNIYLINDEN